MEKGPEKGVKDGEEGNEKDDDDDDDEWRTNFWSRKSHTRSFPLQAHKLSIMYMFSV